MAATSVVFVRPASTDTTVSSAGCVGDPQAVDEARRLAARAQLGVDRAAAAVDDDERVRGGEAHDGLRRRADGGGVFEQLAAKLEDRRSIEPHRFVEAERDVEVLNRLPGRALHEVVDARDHDELAAGRSTRHPMSQ